MLLTISFSELQITVDDIINFLNSLFGETAKNVTQNTYAYSEISVTLDNEQLTFYLANTDIALCDNLLFDYIYASLTAHYGTQHIIRKTPSWFDQYGIPRCSRLASIKHISPLFNEKANSPFAGFRVWQEDLAFFSQSVKSPDTITNLLYAPYAVGLPHLITLESIVEEHMPMHAGYSILEVQAYELIENFEKYNRTVKEWSHNGWALPTTQKPDYSKIYELNESYNL